MSAGHHPVHTGLQSHSVGGAYPLAIVGYGHPTRYVIENLAEGTVLCCKSVGMVPASPYQSKRVSLQRLVELLTEFEFKPNMDVWVKGRPRHNVYGDLSM